MKAFFKVILILTFSITAFSCGKKADLEAPDQDKAQMIENNKS